jgi:hypothetical protein
MSVATALGLFIGTPSASATCQLSSPGGKITRVVYIIFDNVHLRRDNPNVPSDLEQMPNLLNFLQGRGIVSGNHHTPLISHTADDILTGLTGVYGDFEQLRNLQGRQFFVRFPDFLRLLDDHHGAEPS